MSTDEAGDQVKGTSEATKNEESFMQAATKAATEVVASTAGHVSLQMATEDDVEQQRSEAIIEQVRNNLAGTLYDEIMDALHGAYLMFCLPDLKALAKEGTLKGDEEMLKRLVEPPISMWDVVEIFAANQEYVTEERLKDSERAEMYHAAMSMQRFQDQFPREILDTVMKQIFLIDLDDVNEDEECVYAIGINKVRKRVTIAFRGSVTKKDFQQDAKALFSGLQNPIKADESEDLPEEMGIHLGFKEYLYVTKKEIESDPDKKPKYKAILDKAAELVKDYPDYQLRIVGHSLGGALTTLLSLEAAADERFPSPITAITSGAPKVGNLSFLLTYEYLERTGRIRCIQVANNKDPVTKAPPIGNFDPIAPFLYRNAIFRHVGLRLLLLPHGFVIWYPMKAKSRPGILAYDLRRVITNCCMMLCGCIVLTIFCNAFALLIALPMCCCWSWKVMKRSRQHHTQLKYIHRIEFSEKELNELYLDRLNEERFGARTYCLSRTLVKFKTKNKYVEAVSDTIQGSINRALRAADDKEDTIATGKDPGVDVETGGQQSK